MDRLRRRYTAAWVGWVVAFGVIETCALRHEHGGTLSEHMRAAFGMRYDSHPMHKAAGLVAVGAFSVWLIPHLLHDTHFLQES